MDLRRLVWELSILAAALAATAARGEPLPSVTIWNYVGEAILVHCRDQFTDLEPRGVPHDADYVFSFRPSPDGTTLYTCAFAWGRNKTQELPVWRGEKAQAAAAAATGTTGGGCGTEPPSAPSASACLYKVTKEGFFVASSAAAWGRGGGDNLSVWFFIHMWKENGNGMV